MKTISISATKELEELHRRGFTREVVKSSTDGTDIIVATNAEGLTRIFNVYELEDK